MIYDTKPASVIIKIFVVHFFRYDFGPQSLVCDNGMYGVKVRPASKWQRHLETYPTLYTPVV